MMLWRIINFQNANSASRALEKKSSQRIPILLRLRSSLSVHLPPVQHPSSADIAYALFRRAFETYRSSCNVFQMSYYKTSYSLPRF